MKLLKLKLALAALLAASVMMLVGCKNNNDDELPNGYYYTSNHTITIYVDGDDVRLMGELRDQAKISITNASNGYITFSWSYNGDNGTVIGYYDSGAETLTMQSGVSGMFAANTVFKYNGKAVPIF